MGLFGPLAEAVGIREDALLMFLSIQCGYPFALIYKHYIHKCSITSQHVYFILFGLFIYFGNYGFQILHTLFAIAAAYVLTNYLGHIKNLPIIAHLIFLGHLLVCYYFYETDDYDVTFTTPLCIMCLRMISICIDVSDGFQPKDKLTGDAISNSIQVPPNLMEITSYALYLPFTMIGPVVPFNYFKRYVNGEFKAQNGEVRGESTTVAVRRFLLGILFTVLHEGGKLFITADYLNTPQFFENSLLLKIVYTTIWYRFTFYRYVGAFLFAEGAGILCGMGYKPNGKDSDEKWSGCRNVHVTGFLLGSDYQSVVESFNIATNTWSKNYVFKRLRFLGNRTLSQAGTLMYLALWHGYHLGYFLLFGFEFLCFLSQDRLYSIISRIPNARNVLNGTKVKWMTWLFGKVMITTTMGFGFLTFGLIKTKYWWDPLMSQYAWGYVLFLIVWPAIYYLLDKVYPDVKKEKKEKKEN